MVGWSREQSRLLQLLRQAAVNMEKREREILYRFSSERAGGGYGLAAFTLPLDRVLVQMRTNPLANEFSVLRSGTFHLHRVQPPYLTHPQYHSLLASPKIC